MNRNSNCLRISAGCGVVLISLVAYAVTSFAQSSLGLEFGVGQNNQSGTFSCPCGTAFTGGGGNGWFASAFFELPVGEDFSAGIKAGYDQENIGATVAIHSLVVAEGSGTQSDTIEVILHHNAAVVISYIRFEPFVQYQIFHSRFFIQLGAAISAITSSRFTQMDEIVAPAVTFTNGTNTETISDGSVAGINPLQFSGLLSAGYNFSLLGATIAPIVTYDYPFSNVSSQNSNNWKISTISVSLALKLKI